MLARDPLKITTVYRFGDGMIVALDQHGEPMLDYQGRDVDVLDKIRARYDGPIVETDWMLE
jgi:hypothetical protein